MNISFLADRPEYAKQIAQWYYDEWGRSVPDVTVETIHEKVLEKSLSRKQFPLSLVLHEDQELLATAELKFREHKSYPEYEHWIGGVYVHPDHRGKGLSNLIVAEAKAHVLALGIKLLYLQCEEHNIALYRKHGFKELLKTEHLDVTTTIMVWETGA